MSIRLKELLDLPSLQEMLHNLWQASGIPLGLIDAQGEMLVAIGWQSICTDFHRRHPELAPRCLLNHPPLPPDGGQSQRSYEIRCRSGLLDIIVPIYCEGEYLGQLLLGQLFDSQPDRGSFREQAVRLGCDPDRYLEMVDEVPVIPRPKLEHYLAFYHSLLQLLIEAGLRKVREAQDRQDLEISRQALHDSEERFRSIVQATPLGIHMYQCEADGRLVFVGYNPAADAILGVDNRQFLGKELLEAFPGLADTEVPKRYRQVCASGESWQTEQFSYVGGKISGAFEVHAFRTGPNRMASVFMDISERLNALEKIQASEATLRSILTAAPMSIGLGHGRVFSWVNRWMLEMLGYREEQMIGQNARILYDSDAEFERVGLVRAATVDRGEMGEVETRWRRSDGTAIDVLLRFTRIVPDDPAPGVIFAALNITASKQAAAELREREERIRLLLDSSGEAVYGADVDGRCTFVNPRCLELLGYHHERELLGRRLNDLVQCAPREDAESCDVECRIFAALRNGESVHMVGETFWRSDGSSFPVEYWSYPMFKEGAVVGTVINFIDISERLQAEQRLTGALQAAQQAREQVNAILRSVADALIVIEPRGSVLMANPAAVDLLGGDVEWIVGRQITELLSDQRFLDHLGKAIAGDERSGLFDLVSAPGNANRVLQARVATIRDEGQGLYGVVASLRDITREREVERLKDDFISTAAHELRTPITAILGYAEIILDQFAVLSPAQLQQYLGVICSRTEALTQIVAEMLDLSRMQSGQVIQLDMQPGDMSALASEVVSHYRLAGDCHRFLLQTDESLPIFAFDPAKLRQVFDNLISNAFKFSPPTSEIAITVERQKEDAVVTVVDQGVGMTAEQVERIFDKFYRADASNTAVSGLGLGMSLVKGIIEGHGGRIRVVSRPGLGTTVSFTLPIVRPYGE